MGTADEGEPEQLSIRRWLDCRQLLFLVESANDSAEKEKAWKELQERASEFGLSAFLRLASTHNSLVTSPTDLCESLSSSLAVKMRAHDESVEKAAVEEGEDEERLAWKERSVDVCRGGSFEDGRKSFDEVAQRTKGLGMKLDEEMRKARLGMFWGERRYTRAALDASQEILKEIGDWERRNRLKVYEALYFLEVRQFSKASELLLDSMATFTAHEVISFTDFIKLTVLSSVISLDRPSLKKRIIRAPEILGCAAGAKDAVELAQALYDCDYSAYFAALAKVSESMKRDVRLAPHVRFFTREARVVAYTQFLVSYKSVTISTMADAFGVSEEFLDEEVSRFIAAQRLPCKIDKVAGVIETNRPDKKNAQYQELVKQGDALLNRVQKLSRVISY